MQFVKTLKYLAWEKHHVICLSFYPNCNLLKILTIEAYKIPRPYETDDTFAKLFQW